MRPIRLAEHLAAEARAVERDRRRPPVAVDKPTRTSVAGGVSGSFLASGTGSAVVEEDVPVPEPGMWAVVIHARSEPTSSSGWLSASIASSTWGLERVPLIADGVTHTAASVSAVLPATSVVGVRAQIAGTGGLDVNLFYRMVRIGDL